MSTVPERLVLQLISTRQATSQVGIAQHLGLPTNTVHGIIQRLLKSRLIRLQEVSRSGGRGRPVQHYRVWGGIRVLVVQWLGSIWCAGVFADQSAITSIQTWNSAPRQSRSEAFVMLQEIKQRMLAEAQLAPSDLNGMVIAINARRSGDFLESSVMPWVKDLSEEEFARQLECPVQIETRFPNLAAEMTARIKEGCRSLTVFNVGDGVSAHTLLHDGTWATTRDLRGELGHVVVDPQGPRCGCGHRGCLEALISGPSLIQRVADDVARGIQTRLAEQLKESPNNFLARLDELDANGGDPYASTIVREFLQHCAWGISIVINLVQPDVIVLSGYTLLGREHWRQRLLEAIRPLALHGESAGVRLEFPRLGAEDHLRELAERFEIQAVLRKAAA